MALVQFVASGWMRRYVLVSKDDVDVQRIRGTSDALVEGDVATNCANQPKGLIGGVNWPAAISLGRGDAIFSEVVNPYAVVAILIAFGFGISKTENRATF